MGNTTGDLIAISVILQTTKSMSYYYKVTKLKLNT